MTDLTLTSELTLDTTHYNAALSSAMSKTNAELSKLQQTATAISNSFADMFKGLAAGVGVASLSAAVTSTIKLADVYTQMTARLKNATKSTTEYVYVLKRLKENTQGTYRSLSEAFESFENISRPLQELGYSLKTILDFNDALTYAFTSNATSGERAKTAINALAKSFARGKIDGQSFTSVIQAIPDLVQQLSAVTGKAPNIIRQLGLAGEIDISTFVTAVSKMRDTYKQLADSMSVSVKDGFTYLVNKLQEYVGEVNKATSVTNLFGLALKGIGDHLKPIATAVATIAISTGWSKATTILKGLTTAMLQFSSAIRGIAWSLFAAGVTKAMAKSKALKHSLGDVLDYTKNLNISKNDRHELDNQILRADLAKSLLNQNKTPDISNIAALKTQVNTMLSNMLAIVKRALPLGLLYAIIISEDGIGHITAIASKIATDITNIFKGIGSIVKQAFIDIGESFKNLLPESTRSTIVSLFGDMFTGVNEYFKQFDVSVLGSFKLLGSLADAVVVAVKAPFKVLYSLIENVAKRIKLVILSIKKELLTAFPENVSKKLFGELGDLKTIEAEITVTKSDLDAIKSAGDIVLDTYQNQRNFGLQSYFEDIESTYNAEKEARAEMLEKQKAELEALNNATDSLNELAKASKTNAELERTKQIEKIGDINQLEAQLNKLIRDKSIYDKDFDRKKYDDLTSRIAQLNSLGVQTNWNEVSRLLGTSVSSRQDGLIGDSKGSDRLDGYKGELAAINNATDSLNMLAEAAKANAELQRAKQIEKLGDINQLEAQLNKLIRDKSIYDKDFDRNKYDDLTSRIAQLNSLGVQSNLNEVSRLLGTGVSTRLDGLNGDSKGSDRLDGYKVEHLEFADELAKFYDKFDAYLNESLANQQALKASIDTLSTSNNSISDTPDVSTMLTKLDNISLSINAVDSKLNTSGVNTALTSNVIQNADNTAKLQPTQITLTFNGDTVKGEVLASPEFVSSVQRIATATQNRNITTSARAV